MNFDKIAAVLNALAAVGASLQASGHLEILGPTGAAIAVAVLGVINAISHALAPAPAAPPSEK